MLCVAFSTHGALAGEAAAFRPATCGPASLQLVDGIPITHLYGSHEEMGRQHGTLLRSNIKAVLRRYLDRLLRSEKRRQRILVLARKMEKQIPAGYLAEMKAVAKSADVPYDDVLLANTVFDLKGELFCSAMVAVGKRSEDGRPVFGRTLDFLSFGMAHKHSHVVVFHPDEGRPVASVAFPGMVGTYSGMNDAGLSAGVMMVFRRGHDVGAPPYAMVFRTALERSKTTAEALKIVGGAPRATGNNLMVCDAAGSAACIELDPKRTVIRRPTHGALYATNHFRSRELRQFWPCWRVGVMQRMLARVEKIDEPWMRRLLRAVGQGGRTMHSMVFRPATCELDLALGDPPATRNRYVRLRRNVLFPKRPDSE
jgi:predicted choloylglycine hydrolase